MGKSGLSLQNQSSVAHFNSLYWIAIHNIPQLLMGRVEVHRLQCKNCQYRFLGQYPSKMYDFFSWAPFTKRDDYQPPSGPFNWYKTHSTGPSGFYHWIDAVAPFHHRAIHSPIWRGRQNVVATQIQTDGRMLTKLFAHVLDTQIQLLGKTHPPHPRRNPLKKRSLSENATKRRRRQKINRRASHCGDF